MLRLSELKLPLSAAEHPEAALRAGAARLLGITEDAITGLQVFKRSFDARKAELLAVYIVDLQLSDPAAEGRLLARFAAHPHVAATPDMAWQPPARAPAGFPLGGASRPVVVGFGPAGIAT